MALKACRILGKKFQKIWWLFCRKQKKDQIVDKTIHPEEQCARCVIYPYHVRSSHTLKYNAFMPPPASSQVSVLRLRYCDQGFAFSHGKRISKTGRLDGLAIITQRAVEDVNSWAQSDDSKLGDEKNGISAIVMYAPMINDEEYASVTEDIFLNDPNVLLPMHADLTYSVSCSDEIQTKMRQYARELVKRVCEYIICP